MQITESAVRDIVRYYTREAGVRSLERELSKICRKVVKGLLLKKLTPQVVVTADDLPEDFGCAKCTYGLAEQQNQIGQVVGLAWTEVGGDLLTIEVVTMPGKGVITRTGSLGDVMKESVEAARTVVRSRARVLASKTRPLKNKTCMSTRARRRYTQRRLSAGAAMATAGCRDDPGRRGALRRRHHPPVKCIFFAHPPYTHF